MAQTTQLPPPYGGQNDRVPLAALEHPFAERVTNYSLDDGIAKLRKGDSVYADGSALGLAYATYGLSTWSAGTNEQLVGIATDTVAGRSYAIEVTGGSFSSTTLGFIYGDECQSLKVGNRLYFFLKRTSAGVVSINQVYYEGTPGAWTVGAQFTFSGTFNPFGGCIFKNRAYLIDYASRKYAYSAIDAVTGACTTRDMTTVLTKNGTLVGIRSITLSEGVQAENLLVFVFNTGEVLAYKGSYPDSADWSIVGRFIIPKPLGYNCFVDASGDSYVITECGLESLRDLFAGGNKAAKEVSISASITNRWDQVFSTLYPGGVPSSNSLYIKGIYDQGRDRIVVTFPQYVTHDGQAVANTYFRLVYSQKTKSWFEHWGYVTGGSLSGLGVTHPVYFKNDIYYGGATYAMTYKADGATGYQDTTTASPHNLYYQLRTAPLPLGKYGVNKISGVEVLMKSDLYEQTNVKIVGDLGRVETAAQTTSGDGTNISKPMINAGIEAAYAQIDISGTTTSGKTVGQEIYGLNIWYDQGGLR